MKPDKGNNKKNTWGLISLILWALMLTLIFRSCSNSYANSNQVQVEYSVFRQWVVAELVEEVHMESDHYVITLKEGKEEEALAFIPEDENQGQGGNMFAWMPVQNEKDTEYVTTPPPVSDLAILDMMDSHGVQFYRDPPDTAPPRWTPPPRSSTCC